MCWPTRFSEAWRAPEALPEDLLGEVSVRAYWLSCQKRRLKRSPKRIKSAALNNGVKLLDFATGINLFSEDHEEARLCSEEPHRF